MCINIKCKLKSPYLLYNTCNAAFTVWDSVHNFITEYVHEKSVTCPYGIANALF